MIQYVAMLEQQATKRNRFQVVPLIIVINVLVFFGWHLTKDSEFMINNFLISWTSLTENHYWTLITSVFSHNMFWHLFLNMYVLLSFGQILEKILGTKSFLKFYFIAGIISSLSHAMVSKWILNQPDLPALGASGAISGLILVFAFLFPKEKILILGLIPVPALAGALIFVGLDMWGLIAQAEGGGLPIGHGAHLGGAFTGILYYFFYLRPTLLHIRESRRKFSSY